MCDPTGRSNVARYFHVHFGAKLTCATRWQQAPACGGAALSLRCFPRGLHPLRSTKEETHSGSLNDLVQVT